ncbi:MAG: MFS transporter [Chlamydiales bacterium]
MSIFAEERSYYPAIITANVILATFLAVCSAITTLIADSAIQGELALSDTDAIWLTTLYLLGINLTVPTGDWFANRFGFNQMYTYGIIFFVCGSLLAALAQNFWMIASARFIEGVGAGFIFPVGLSLIIKNLPKSRIALGINLYIAGAFGGGIGLGLPLSGYFTQFQSWRMLFFLIAFGGSLAGAACWHTKPSHSQQSKTPFDVLGLITFALFVSTLLIALTLGPIPATDAGWRTPYIIAFFVIAVLSLFACIFVENRHPDPLIPMPLFKDPIFSVSLAAMFLLGMATFASVATSVQYMLNGLLYEKFITGQTSSIYGIVIAIFSIIASYLVRYIPLPILTFVGLSCLSFSYFYNNELSFLTGADQVIPILTIRGIGIGLSLGPTTILALYGVPHELKSAAATILTFFRQVGATYGGTLISIFSIRQTIFHAARFGEQANTQLPGYKMTFHNLYNKYPDAAQAKAAIVKSILNQAYIQGLNDALIVFGYVTGIVGAILAILISIRMWKNRKRIRS